MLVLTFNLCWPLLPPYPWHEPLPEVCADPAAKHEATTAPAVSGPSYPDDASTSGGRKKEEKEEKKEDILLEPDQVKGGCEG